ncbi:hypothetical protein [Sphaerisporangium rhizosphaerae]|uniref:Uncharacterized protein n=1 Tax=Sphaerisporangium rhizosphaerae TaxID=2269375 RepID=A0ABW2PDM3_9ACTN
MSDFHEWDAVKREIFDEEDIAAIDKGTTVMVAVAKLAQVVRRR